MTYLNVLKSYGFNSTHVYPWILFEPVDTFMNGNTHGVQPGNLILPWARSNQPGCAQGGNRFDLDRWDPAFFDRLRDFATRAAERGIVVEICFFNAQYADTWPISPLFHSRPWNRRELGTPASITHGRDVRDPAGSMR